MTTRKSEGTLVNVNRGVFWVSGAVSISLGVWCLRLALRSGLSTIWLDSIPIDTRMMTLLSFVVEMVFFSLLCFSGGFSAYLGSTTGTGSVWSALSPSFLKLTVLLGLIALSVLVLSERAATSKITWRESRGAPLAFLSVTEYRGPDADFNFCTYRIFNNLHLLPLVLDAFAIYYSICVGSQALRRLVDGLLDNLSTRWAESL